MCFTNACHVKTKTRLRNPPPFKKKKQSRKLLYTQSQKCACKSCNVREKKSSFANRRMMKTFRLWGEKKKQATKLDYGWTVFKSNAVAEKGDERCLKFNQSRKHAAKEQTNPFSTFTSRWLKGGVCLFVIQHLKNLDRDPQFCPLNVCPSIERDWCEEKKKRLVAHHTLTVHNQFFVFEDVLTSVIKQTSQGVIIQKTKKKCRYS